MQWQRDAYEIDTDRNRLDLGVIHGFLHTSYWARGIPREAVARSCDASICFGLYLGSAQVGFARVVTDRVRFAWLADVFVLESERGHGLARWLVACALEHPDTTEVNRFLLATADAHGVYEPLGFSPPERPQNLMERRQAPRWGR